MNRRQTLPSWVRHLHRLRHATVAASVLSICALTALATAGEARADWPGFRGPNHDGKSAETGLSIATKKPLKLLWEAEVGSAFSSFACVGDKVYTCGSKDGWQVLSCLNADTGKVVWTTQIENEFKDQFGDGSRATPTVDDGRVYVLGAHGTLLCADAATGKKIWNLQFNHQPQWGYSGSVLIEGDLAIATGGKKDGSLAAFDKKTGKPVWKAGTDPTGYATPYPFTFEGKRYVVGFTGKSAIIVDMGTGQVMLRIPWKTDYEVNAASPIYHDGFLFLTSGYRTGAGLFKLGVDGDKLTADSVWRSKVVLNKFQSCILHEGKLYTSDQKALKCVDFLTGKEEWSIRRGDGGALKNGTLVLAEEKLILLTEFGQLQVAKASPKGFKPSTTADILSGRCWSVPVIHNGRLFARNLERVVCFDISG